MTLSGDDQTTRPCPACEGAVWAVSGLSGGITTERHHAPDCPTITAHRWPVVPAHHLLSAPAQVLDQALWTVVVVVGLLGFGLILALVWLRP